MTTPLHWSLPPSCGDCSATVISAHSLNGVGLRNSMPPLWTETASVESSSRDWRPSTVICCFGKSMLPIFLALILHNQINTLWPIVKWHSPFNNRRAPSQTRPEYNQQNQIAARNFSCCDGFIQRNRHGRGGGVAVFMEVHKKLLRRGFKT